MYNQLHIHSSLIHSHRCVIIHQQTWYTDPYIEIPHAHPHTLVHINILYLPTLGNIMWLHTTVYTVPCIVCSHTSMLPSMCSIHTRQHWRLHIHTFTHIDMHHHTHSATLVFFLIHTHPHWHLPTHTLTHIDICPHRLLPIDIHPQNPSATLTFT